jgi:hypothetical protein
MSPIQGWASHQQTQHVAAGVQVFCNDACASLKMCYCLQLTINAIACIVMSNLQLLLVPSAASVQLLVYASLLLLPLPVPATACFTGEAARLPQELLLALPHLRGH